MADAHAPDGVDTAARRALSHQATTVPFASRPAIRAPMLWGIVVGVLQATTPLVFWWLDSATVYALGLVVIAAVYVGFAVADGRPRIIAAESSVAFASSSWPPPPSPDHRDCSSPASPATDSRTSGSTAPTSSPTPDGGRRSA